MAHAFLSLGQLAQAHEAASATLRGLEQRVAKQLTPETLSLNGAFHLVLAITAARENDWQQAVTHLAHAHEIAASIAEDRDDFGTEFGPGPIASHAQSPAISSNYPDHDHGRNYANWRSVSACSLNRQKWGLNSGTQLTALRGAGTRPQELRFGM